MAQLGPGTLVTPPRRVSGFSGLLDVFDPVPTPDSPKWELGITVESPGCGTTVRRAVACAPSDVVPSPEGPSELFFATIEVESEYTCSSYGWQEGRYAERALEITRRWRSHELEGELWTGTAALDGGFSTGFLTDPVDLTLVSAGAAIPLPYALARLQMAIKDGLGGEIGVIHARADTVSLWQMAGAIFSDFSEGGLLRDIFGNYIVAGSGYSGASPYTLDGGGVIVPDSSTRDETLETAWAYATGMIDIRSGELRLEPATLESALDRSTNDVTFQANQTLSAAFDSCFRAGVNVDMCNTCCVAA